MKRLICALLAFLLLLTGCAAAPSSAPAPEMIIGEGSVLSRPAQSSQPQGSGEVPAVKNDSVASSSESSSGSIQQQSAASAPSSLAAPSSKTESSQMSASSAAAQSSAQSSAPKSSASSVSPQPDASQTIQTPAVSVKGDEYRAVWFSYLDLGSWLQGKSQSTFRSNVRAAFTNVADMGCNVIIAQVRPFGDALYKSEYFPWSYLCTGQEGQDPGFDPLQVMIDEAHSLGLSIEAWVNPYRIRTAGSKYGLSGTNQASVWENEGSDNVIRYNGGIYYNPGRAEVRKHIISGVKELVKNYEIDGIHFDDYFYPNPDSSFDAEAYRDYRSEGGNLSLGDWRRENVNILVRDTYAAIKAIDPSVRFGVSPQANNDINYNQQYIDVKPWLSVSGYVDYICPQIYYGFDNETCPYEETVALWNKMIKTSGIELYVGLAVYKIGQTDNWAGSGKYEWVNQENILARQVQFARESESYGGFALFRYASLFAPDSSVKTRVEKERNTLADLL